MLTDADLDQMIAELKATSHVRHGSTHYVGCECMQLAALEELRAWRKRMQRAKMAIAEEEDVDILKEMLESLTPPARGEE